ncbi:hypothetical protein [Subtercola sp. YIM 133946]|uniref:hypothetical protein n=1 Tax=Subtercola sp. YIM 133946 TaxID=3118909 RepID=UPI002F95A6C0
MKRINIIYGGQPYSIGGRELDDVMAEIGAGLRSPEPRWLTANFGEGMPREVRLLLTSGVDLAIIPVPGVDEDAAESSGEAPPPKAR